MLVSQLESIMSNYKFNDRELASFRFYTIIGGRKYFYAIDRDKFSNFAFIRMDVTCSNVEDFPNILEGEVVVSVANEVGLLHNLSHPDFDNLRRIRLSYVPDIESELEQVGQIPLTSKFERMVDSGKKYIQSNISWVKSDRPHLYGIGISSEFLTATNGHIMFYYFEDNPNIARDATFILYESFFRIINNMTLLDARLYVPAGVAGKDSTVGYTICNGYVLVDKSDIVYVDVGVPCKPYSGVYPNIRSILPEEEDIRRKYEFKVSFKDLKGIQESSVKKLTQCIGVDKYKEVMEKDTYVFEFRDGKIYGYILGFENYVEYYSKDIMDIHEVYTDVVEDGVIVNFSVNYLRTVLFMYDNPKINLCRYSEKSQPCLVEYDNDCFSLIMCKRFNT